MIFQFEILLVLGALAFYLQDSCALLYADELMLERVGGGWRVHSGAAMLVAGRRPLLPNPLAPHRPLLRVSLQQLLGDGPAARDHLGHYLSALAPFKVASVALLLLFVPALPLVLYFFGTGVELLCWLALVYGAVARIAATLFQRRRVLHLSRRDCAALAFECACCPPLAINIVRKLTLRAEARPMTGYPAISAGGHPSLLIAAGQRIEEMLRRWESGTPQAQTLLQYRERLLAGGRAQ